MAHCVEEADFASPQELAAEPRLWSVHEVETTVNFCPGNRVLTCLVGGLNYTPPEVSFPSIRASPGPADVSAAKRCERAVRAVEPPSICNRCSGVTELRRDPITGRLVAVAHERGLRPGAWRVVENEEADCPFCAGREERTPPETLRYGEPWRVRVVPNLYPALERQEVVIHCPEHHRSLAELDDGQLELVAAAWQERARAAREDRFAYVHALVNEGREAGSSLPHSHSQLVWLREPPPAVTSERGKLAWTAEQVVLEADRLVGFCPYGARMPYETCVAPAAPEGHAFESKLLAPALQLLAVLIRRLERVLGERPPLNVWLHDGDHWHLELLPRLTVLAGVELGAGIYVNAVPPEAAATDLRKA